MSDQGGAPDYSTLANALAQISQQRADYERQNPAQINPGSAVGSGGSFGYQQAFNDNMAKVWSYYAGLNLPKNSFGRAPQILDNQKELQWMQSALADPSGGGGVFSGGMLHTPHQTVAPDNSNPQADRAARDPYHGTVNSNTGMANGVDPRTGQPYYTGSNALVPGALSQLAQNPQHAQDLVNYIAMTGNGGTPGGTYQYNGNQGYSAQVPQGAPIYPGFIPANGRGGAVDENGSWQDQMQAYPGDGGDGQQ